VKQLRGTPLKRFIRRLPPPPYPTELAFVCQSVAYPVNVGSIFRLADALPVHELVLCGITPTPPHPKIVKVGRAKHTRVPWRYEEDVHIALQALRDRGFWIAALEVTDDCHPYYAVDYPEHVALVVGNEDHGVTTATLAACDAAVYVPLYGRGRSLNVQVALAVVAYHILHGAGADEPHMEP
jgi:23S rRNA (guanosine2251-2'-O)-methyltransferase